MVRKITITLGIAAMSLATAACNTWDGMGEDVESAGDAIEEGTDEVG